MSSYTEQPAKPAWWLVDEQQGIVASFRAHTALEARDEFKRQGLTGARVIRAEYAPVDADATPRCIFCGGGVDPEADYQHIHAYRKKRHGTNSANYVRLMEPHPDEQWACQFCVDRESSGVAANQQTLV